MRGTCRIEIEKHPLGPGLPAFVAHLWMIDRHGRPRPLVLRDGSPAEIRGETESVALSSALVFLESRFGPTQRIRARVRCDRTTGVGTAGCD